MAEDKESEGFDDIWNVLPHISVYQIRISGLAGYLAFVAGFMAMYPVFAQYKPDARCQSVFDQDPQFDFLTFDEVKELMTNTPSCNNYVTGESECSMCNFTMEAIDSCADAASFDGLSKCLSDSSFQTAFSWVACDEYEFDRSLRPDVTRIDGAQWQTAITEFSLICGMDWFNALLTAMGLFGLFIGAFIAGMYTDRFGRKNSIVVWSAVCAGCLVIHAFMPEQYSFMVMRTLGNGANHIAWIAYISYSVEVLGPTKRSVAGVLTHVYFSFGYMASSALGYLLPDWHAFTLGIAILHIPIFIFIPFYPESPRFLYGAKRFKEGRKVLLQFSKKTKSELVETDLDDFEQKLQETTEKATNASSDDKQFSIIDLFRDCRMGLVALNVGIAFMVNTLVYYGLSFNVDSLAGNLYVNNVINGAVELLAYIMCILLLDKLGRKLMLGGLMIGGGAICIASMLLTEFGVDENGQEIDWMFETAKWLSFLGKFAISGSFCVLYVFAAELFPTEVRSIGIGFGSMVGRVGGIVAPFIILLQDTEGLSFVPYLIFGIGGIVSGTWALFLPETAGQPIMQTIDEAIAFYQGSKHKPGTDTLTTEEARSEL